MPMCVGGRCSTDYIFLFTLKTGPNSLKKKKKEPMEAINTEMYFDLKYYKEKTQQTHYGSKKKVFLKS